MPSLITLFLICFFVAPTLDSIPYIFIFSVNEIANAFFIQYILVIIIITIATTATATIIAIVELLTFNASHVNKS